MSAVVFAGPWRLDHHEATLRGHVAISSRAHTALAQVVWKMEDDERSPNCEAVAQLIVSAPAMALALRLMELGLARIVVSPTVPSLVEFALGGLRYDFRGDWSALLDVIGWDKARAAVTVAESARGAS